MNLKKVTYSAILLFDLLYSQKISTVSLEMILAAMKKQTGYNVATTTNVARFQANVLLDIAYNTLEEYPDSELLFLDAKVWYEAFQEFTGLDDDIMPEYSRLALKIKQDQILDLRQEKVFSSIEKGRKPSFAMNVILGWQNFENTGDFYAFSDTLSVPSLEVTNNRVVTYRILDFHDMICYKEIQGISGQPTSGILGLIFQFIGKGNVMWSHITTTSDGLQIVRARVKKGLFEIESTLTVYPDGHTINNLPKELPELKIYEKLLMQPIEIEFLPIEPAIIEIISGE